MALGPGDPGPLVGPAPDPHTAPHWPSAALVTIDTQVDVLDGGALAVPGTSTVLPTLARLVQAFRSAGRPVVHVVRLYPADGHDVDLVRRTLVATGAPVLRPGTPGAELAPGLAPGAGRLDGDRLLAGEVQPVGPDEVVLYKPRWGAFYRTPLAGHLAGRAVDTVVVAGANFPNCPRTTLYEASERDFRLVLVADATSGLTDVGAAEVAAIGVSVLPAATIAAALVTP